MNGLNYLVNSQGVPSGVFIDFETLQNTKKNYANTQEFWEDLEDILAYQLSKDEPKRRYSDFQKELVAEGML